MSRIPFDSTQSGYIAPHLESILSHDRWLKSGRSLYQAVVHSNNSFVMILTLHIHWTLWRLNWCQKWPLNWGFLFYRPPRLFINDPRKNWEPKNQVTVALSIFYSFKDSFLRVYTLLMLTWIISSCLYVDLMLESKILGLLPNIVCVVPLDFCFFLGGGGRVSLTSPRKASFQGQLTLREDFFYISFRG